MYQLRSAVSFADIMSGAPIVSTFSDENYANLSSKANLMSASSILLVIYDEHNRTRVELEFSGVRHPSDWFSRENLVSSTPWNLTTLKNPGTSFNMTESGFQIITANDAMCQNTGFVKLTCDLETECAQFKWWLDDQSLDRFPCGVVYSKVVTPVNFIRGFWASKIQILTKGLTQWTKVLKIESFSGLDPYTYYNDGSTDFGLPSPNTYFRDADADLKVTDASFIKFQVFNLNMTKVVSELIFRGTGYPNKWFRKRQLIATSLWNFDQTGRSPFSPSGTNMTTFQRRFSIGDKTMDCESVSVWLAMTVVFKGQPCPGEQMSLRQSTLSHLGLTEYEPPFILYSPTPHAQKLSDMEVGGKFEIHVLE